MGVSRLLSLWLFSAAFAMINAGETHAAESIPATGYFVDCANGNDSASGTADATAWRTLDKANNSVTTSGADLWIKSGTTCSNQQLTVDWSGTPSDRVVIGSYYVSGGVAYQGYEGASRATIVGTYAASCSVTQGGSGTCPMGGASNGVTEGAVPINRYTGLVQIRTPYVTVQDLHLDDSSGYGIGVDTFGADYVLIQRNLVTDAASAGILVNRARYPRIIANTVLRVGVGGNYGDSRWNDHPGAINVFGDWENGKKYTTPLDVHAVIDGNTIQDSYTETAYIGRARYGVMRNNYASNNRVGGYYAPNVRYMVYENNIAVNMSSGYAVGQEDFQLEHNEDVEVIFRNNFAANVQSCFNFGMEPLSRAAGYKLRIRFIGNTCLGVSKYYIRNQSGSTALDANIAYMEIADNIFGFPNGSPMACSQINKNSGYNFHHNGWQTRPQSAECDGVGDRIGASGISSSIDWANLRTIPTRTSFAIANATEFGGAGLPMTTSIGSAADYFYSGFSSCAPPIAIWQQRLGADATCAIRSGPSSSMGAIEGSRDQPGNYILSVD